MVKITALFVLSALSCLVSAAPVLEKRIAQVTSDSKAAWEQACVAAGGGAQCNKIGINAASTLLAAADACAQQDAADDMIDLAKQLDNDPEMIRLAQLFVQQPRNAPDSLQVPYCQQAPKNAELDGLFHCQFEGSKFPDFSGDQTGNVPLGLNQVNPPGSCPANPTGPIPDGVQLNTLVDDPGLENAAGGAFSGGASSGGAAPSDNSSDDDEASSDINNGANGGAAGGAEDNDASGGAIGNNSDTGAASAGGDFVLQNGQDAQSQNSQFADITADSPCTDGENACVGSDFAQCVGGKFVTTPCGGNLICAALPLVNAPGTSVTCTTAADRDARIAATGA
ncbi:hypothetical protein Agabi119p4_1402 [Agaricus bisporus var. burnettii]|uniref:Carbohydrate-binding module family 19 domain-containing protein n=1 Tax=Agaricus bisporus var. burnettii TaxID=192524 RepID=A0A8H7F9Q8_AGABI|nr:hypothetical protein Agabi119p4_1402 [Agaricus bisporus var. burnettii]